MTSSLKRRLMLEEESKSQCEIRCLQARPKTAKEEVRKNLMRATFTSQVWIFSKPQKTLRGQAEKLQGQSREKSLFSAKKLLEF